MTVSSPLDSAGRRRSPATMPATTPGARRATIAQHRRPTNRGGDHRRHAPDRRRPPRLEAPRPDHRVWRGGLRIQEALALGERDLDPGRGSLLVRNGKGGRRREIGMDALGLGAAAAVAAARLELPIGPLLCVIDGPTRGRRGRAPTCASSFAGLPPPQVSGAGSRRTSCATRTPSSSPARAWRSTSSSGSSATQPRHDFDLPSGHRHRRDHRHRPRQARADDVRLRRPATLNNPNGVSGSRRSRSRSRCPARAGHRSEQQCERHRDPVAPSHRARTSSQPVASRASHETTAARRKRHPTLSTAALLLCIERSSERHSCDGRPSSAKEHARGGCSVAWSSYNSDVSAVTRA
jgi:hypothetical protein